jgi:hypothetical protein
MSVTARATEAYTAPMSPPTSQYKGKLSNRSWQQLPPEIIRYVSLPPFPRLSRHPRLHNPPVNLARRTRIGNADSLSLISSLIATYYLLDVTTFSYCPHTWDARDAWPSRMVFTLIRDAVQLERLMQICPPWSTARTSFFSSLVRPYLPFPSGVATALVDLRF